VATPVNRFARYVATPGVKTPSYVFAFPSGGTGSEGTSGRLPVYTAQVGYSEHSLTPQDGRQREVYFIQALQPSSLALSPRLRIHYQREVVTELSSYVRQQTKVHRATRHGNESRPRQGEPHAPSGDAQYRVYTYGSCRPEMGIMGAGVVFLRDNGGGLQVHNTGCVVPFNPHKCVTRSGYLNYDPVPCMLYQAELEAVVEAARYSFPTR